jgi:hypothetical protein
MICVVILFEVDKPEHWVCWCTWLGTDFDVSLNTLTEGAALAKGSRPKLYACAAGPT